MSINNIKQDALSVLCKHPRRTLPEKLNLGNFNMCETVMECKKTKAFRRNTEGLIFFSFMVILLLNRSTRECRKRTENIP